MAADDQTDATPVIQDSATRSVAPQEASVTLPPAVIEWLFARTASAPSDVAVSVAVVGARWVVRVENGNACSAIDTPARGEYNAGEVAAAVRRWARAAGFGCRIEGPQGGEARISITPPAATRS